MAIPDPATRFPIRDIDRLVFLKNVITNPMITVGDYTYYDDPAGPERFEDNVLYHFDFVGDRLVIGKFCQIAAKATFVMNGANHGMGGASTYPFAAFGGDWAGRFDGELSGENKGDTIIGNDVWIGYDVLFMPGVHVGDGAIIAARSVVTEDVPPYTIVGGNPARPIRKRFADDDIRFLLDVRWWDWDVKRITRLIPALGQGGVGAFRDAIS
ncbi:MAG: CatB-related O-acetyltransferase [Alphaproteobacteria bacterium]